MPPLAQASAAESCRSGAQLQSIARDLPRVHSRDLLKEGNLILIEHGSERYYLRMTRNNKLILTK